ncbi:MAG: phosphoribosylamine--glycine ligase [Bacteroidales bacterium]
MNILILGSGGREHALARKISQSSLVGKLLIMPGNPGTAAHGQNISGQADHFARIREVVLDHGVSMVVVGPEDPLVKGVHDFILSDPELAGVTVVGPRAAGAQLEGSKEFAKEFMVRHGIPTARYRSFHQGEAAEAAAFLAGMQPPYVLKADGLAAGKGVVILNDLAEAVAEAEAILLHGKFGKAGEKLVIEEFLDGIEVSVFVLTDGKHYLMLPEAKDYKRIGEGDTGPNTGGMGSLSPVPFFDGLLIEKVENRIIRKTIEGLQADEIPYSGFIFFGLMIVNGDPFVIEYNVRLGDPETESVLPRVKSDLVPLFLALKTQTLNLHKVEIDSRAAATVMMVSGGYPGSYPKHLPVTGLEAVEGSVVYHAGTTLKDDRLVTGGGRVFGVTSLDHQLSEALRKSYENAGKIRFEGCYYRRDLGFDILPQE